MHANVHWRTASVISCVSKCLSSILFTSFNYETIFLWDLPAYTLGSRHPSSKNEALNLTKGDPELAELKQDVENEKMKLT